MRILLEIYFKNLQLEDDCCNCVVQDLLLNEISFMIFTLKNINSVCNIFVMDENISMKFQYNLTKIYTCKDNHNVMKMGPAPWTDPNEA